MQSEAQRRYAAANREKINAKNQRWREANREKIREQQLVYAAAHKEERRAYSKEYLARPEIRARRLANSEVRKEKQRAWREANKEHLAESWRRWYAKNREYAIQRANANQQIRRARKMAAGRIEAIDRQAVYERDGGRCHICRRRVSRKDFHVDHLVPLAKGGTHTYDNVALAHPRCNLRRNDGKLPAQLLLVG